MLVLESLFIVDRARRIVFHMKTTEKMFSAICKYSVISSFLLDASFSRSANRGLLLVSKDSGVTFGWILTDCWSYRKGGCRLMGPSASCLPHLILKVVRNVSYNRLSFNIVLGGGTT